MANEPFSQKMKEFQRGYENTMERARASIAMSAQSDLGSYVSRESAQRVQAEYNAIAMRDLHAEQGKHLVNVITKRVQQMQEALKEGETLAVYCDAGGERIKVLALEFPTWNLAVLVGTDSLGNVSHRIENVQDVKLTCKILKGEKERRPIGFTFPGAE
jgi:hypothetical protein